MEEMSSLVGDLREGTGLLGLGRSVHQIHNLIFWRQSSGPGLLIPTFVHHFAVPS
jgi:hypothetical protein